MFVASKIFALSLPHADLVFFSAELSCRNLGSGVRGKLALQTCLVSKFVHLKKHIETQKQSQGKSYAGREQSSCMVLSLASMLCFSMC